MQDRFDQENFSGESPILSAPDFEEEQRRVQARGRLRFAAGRIGWATATLIFLWVGIMVFVSAFPGILGVLGASDAYVAALESFCNRYMLILNELSLGAAIAVAAVILFPIPSAEIPREKISPKGFLKLLLMCFGAGYVGNQIGSIILSVWNFFTDNSVGDELVTLLYDMNPLIMILSVCVLAPILEELFFRKLLTDRLRAFGEVPAILLPAFLFALFHQSASQLIYAFVVGILLGYFYCRTGNYWLTVLIHAVFNFFSGVVTVLFLPHLTGFFEEWTVLESTPDLDIMTLEQLADLLTPLLEKYGVVLVLYAIFSFFLFALNITGIFLLIANRKNFRERKGEYSLGFREALKTVFKTPGMIACTVFMVVMTVLSLFA